MLKSLGQSLSFLSVRERVRYFLLLIFRSSLAILDLIGILAIGFLVTSIAFFVTEGSMQERRIIFAGLDLPAINAQTLPVFTSLILVLFIAKALLSILLTFKLAIFLAFIEARAAKEVSKVALTQNIEDSRNYSRDEVVFAVQQGSTAAFNGILNHFGVIVSEGSLFILIIFAFIFTNPVVAFGAITFFVIVGVLIHFLVGRSMQETGQKISKHSIEANSTIGNLFNVIDEVSVLQRRNFFFEKIHYFRMQSARNYAKQYLLSGMPRYIIETSLIVGIAFFILLQSRSGNIVESAGTIAIFMTGGLRLMASLLPLQQAFLYISKDSPIADKALSLLADTSRLDDLNEVHEEVLDRNNFNARGLSVEIDHVTFGYVNSESQIISDLNLNIRNGSQVALIGYSGAGKSTIAQLILGILKPTSGTIRLNGYSPMEIMRKYPGIVSYVPQKPGLVSGSLLDNIALGIDRDNIDYRRLKSAISKSQLSQLIDDLPGGIDSDLGKHLNEFSGGQLQRIGLARALYSDPELLILDEATNALDAISEMKITESLDSLREKTTVIIIAHRLNIVQKADLVFYIDHGQIVASGKLDQIIRENPSVRDMVELMKIESNHLP